jgi:hypothetical protein
MTLGTLSAGATNGTVTVSGGVEFFIGNATNFTTTTVSDGQLVLSGATFLLTSDPAYLPAPGASFPIIQTGETISGTFTNLAQNGTISAGNISFSGNYTSNLTLTSTTDAPRVTNVYVDGSAWSADFRGYMETTGAGNVALGYQIPTGNVAAFNRNTPNQLNTIPWSNVNRIRVTFSEDVGITASDLVITGVNTATYDGSFAYGQVGGVWTATWTLTSGFFTADKILVNVAGTVASPTSGLQLAGAWTQPTPSTAGSAMPSGGSAGTPFNFRVNMLPGDTNTDTAVTNGDVSIIRAALFTSTSSPGSPVLYTIFKDINGDSAITNADVSITRARLFSQLPAGEPIVPPPSVRSVGFSNSATSGSMTLDEARQLAFAAIGSEANGELTVKKRK